MIGECEALLSGVIELLRADGHTRAAELLASASLSLVGVDQTWEVGERKVHASSFALSLPAESFGHFVSSEDRHLVERALRLAVQSPTTDLGGLGFVLRLPHLARPWMDVYRNAAVRPVERASDEAVLAGAIELGRAFDEQTLAEILERASLAHSDLDASGQAQFVSFGLHLVADDFARAERDAALADRLRWFIRQAGSSIELTVSRVELFLREGRSRPPPDRPSSHRRSR